MSLLARRAARARHNDYDSECVRWFGDRSPARNRTTLGGWKPVPITLRNMNGSPTMTAENRCPICNPYTEPEQDALIDFYFTGELPPGTEWFGAVLVSTRNSGLTGTGTT